MKRGELLMKTLEVLEDAALTGVDLFVVISTAGYGASSRKIEYEMSKRESRRIRERREAEQERALRKQYASYVSKLKQDRLLEERDHGGIAHLFLTKLGKSKLDQLKKKELLPRNEYITSEQKAFTIVAFDIPEKERRKRQWLRDVLRNLGFRMIQKSVWIGRVKIPKSLLEDLLNLQILQFVEIFEITKSGTLKHVT